MVSPSWRSWLKKLQQSYLQWGIWSNFYLPRPPLGGKPKNGWWFIPRILSGMVSEPRKWIYPDLPDKFPVKKGGFERSHLRSVGWSSKYEKWSSCPAVSWDSIGILWGKKSGTRDVIQTSNLGLKSLLTKNWLVVGFKPPRPEKWWSASIGMMFSKPNIFMGK